MDWITAEEIRQLIANARHAADDPGFDPVPLVRLFVRDGDASWLITDLDPRDPDLAYGLCDAGIGLPEEGHFRLSAIDGPTGALGGRPERDRSFCPGPGMTLSVLSRVASAAGRIVV
jgi:hypothetical protein